MRFDPICIWMWVFVFTVAQTLAGAGDGSYLNTPTQFFKLTDSLYILVECWNNRLLYTTSFSAESDDIVSFRVVPTKTPLQNPHTVATNGKILLIDSAETNQVVVLTFKFDISSKSVIFEEIQVLSTIGKRPHYLEYHENSGKFLVLSSISLTIHVLEWDDNVGQVVEVAILQLPKELVYVRSFAVHNEKLYIGPTHRAPSFIEWKLDLQSVPPTLSEMYVIPFQTDRFDTESIEIFETNGVLFHNGRLWVTFYADSGAVGPFIESFSVLECEHGVQYLSGECRTTLSNRAMEFLAPDVAPALTRDKGGADAPFTPYFMTHFDGRIFMGLIDRRTGIYSWPEFAALSSGKCHFCN